MHSLKYIKERALSLLETRIDYTNVDFHQHEQDQDTYMSLKTLVECIDLIEKNKAVQ